MKIGLIGAGQLGSRHLQGIANSNIQLEIEVVEPYENSMKIAKERYYEALNDVEKKINFYKNIDELSLNLDLVIVATTADVRFNIVKELLNKKNVKFLILEKVLFQKINEYYLLEELLNKKNVKCWVNHPRRMFLFYKNLKKELLNSKQIYFNVEGGNWALGCNGLHFIDVFSYLSNNTNIHIDNSGLHNKIYESKRQKFIEFNGNLKGSIGEHIFSIFSHVDTMPIIMTILADNLHIVIDEENGYIRYAKKDTNWDWKVKQEKIVYFQSELTSLLMEDILIKNSCDLPTYKEAMKLHIKFINSLLEHMNKIKNENCSVCPIT